MAAPGGMGGGTLFCVKAHVAAPGGMGGGIWRHLVLCINTSSGTSPRLGSIILIIMRFGPAVAGAGLGSPAFSIV